ncbi:(d)CMP kinase [Corynebacterium sp. A21]|uniref:(d)CMP kinase n=1 Tax=Corynebacterium sp. A21 TaxID=3457318 RepID=UPI003FD4951A
MSEAQLSNQPEQGLILAVDGLSGTGKSTTCRALAKRLNARYVDTGAMYRVATLAVLRAGVDPADTAAVIEATRELPLGISDDPDSTQVLLAGEDVSVEIREAEVTRNVSAVSAIPEVRVNLVNLQRELTKQAHRAIVEGRDIGTTVLVDAPAKAYLTASAQVRAQRRHDQDLAAGRKIDFDTVLADVIRRDELDSSRKTSPLRPAEDAVIIDTSDMGIEEVLDQLVELVRDSAEATAAEQEGK